MRRKNRAASSVGQPALGIARTVRMPTRGSESGGVVRSSGLGERKGSSDQAGQFCTARAL